MANLGYGTNGSSYYDLARQKQVFSAYATITACGIYSTAAGTGGPLLWNNSAAGANRAVNAVLLGVSVAGITTASTAAVSIGLTGNSGQTSAPTSTTAITTTGNLNIGGPSPLCNLYSIGTVSTAGSFFMPLIQLSTAAITVPSFLEWIDLGGSVIVPPGAWVSVASSAIATASVLKVGMVWAEVPI